MRRWQVTGTLLWEWIVTPIYDGHQKEPMTEHRAAKGVMPRDA